MRSGVAIQLALTVTMRTTFLHLDDDPKPPIVQRYSLCTRMIGHLRSYLKIGIDVKGKTHAKFAGVMAQPVV
jgi:hypothetical protein